jgi:hypothetical protein
MRSSILGRRERLPGLRTRLPWVLTAVVLAAAIGGAAHAAIPDSTTGVIHSCYSQSLGTWRPIDTQANPPQKCKSGETQLDFNQKGLQGPAGPAGPAGKDGKDGASVTSTALAEGDSNCPNGGNRFDASNGSSYACNGAPGATGPEGPSDAYVASGGASATAQCCRVDVTHLDLPAGDYLVDLDYRASADSLCELAVPNGYMFGAIVPSGNGVQQFDEPLSLVSPFTLTIVCLNTPNSQQFYSGTITALKVGQLHLSNIDG